LQVRRAGSHRLNQRRDRSSLCSHHCGETSRPSGAVRDNGEDSDLRIETRMEKEAVVSQIESCGLEDKSVEMLRI